MSTRISDPTHRTRRSRVITEAGPRGPEFDPLPSDLPGTFRVSTSTKTIRRHTSMFLCRCNYVSFWQTNSELMQNLFSKWFFLFLPRAGLQINTECARKLLNYSCTKLFKCSWERQSSRIYLLARKQRVTHWRRDASGLILLTCQ